MRGAYLLALLILFAALLASRAAAGRPAVLTPFGHWPLLAGAGLAALAAAGRRRGR